jgi:hypothetical protein
MALFHHGVARRGLPAIAISLIAASNMAHAAVTISTDATFHMKCSVGVCSPTATKAVLNVTDLANMLESSDVKVTTGTSAVDISFASSLTWASAHRLTLDAMGSVVVGAPVVAAGPGGLTILTNDGGSGGDLIFSPSGSADFWDLSSSLVINGKTYVLADSIPALTKAIAANPSGSFALSKSIGPSQPYYGKSPIASLGGTFEGLGHTITNLTFKSSAQYLGLIGSVTSSGVVRDIRFGGGTLKANPKQGQVVGLLAATNAGLIQRSSAAGWVVGNAAGALVGYNSGTISNSSGSGDVYGYQGAGGLVGINPGTVTDSLSDAGVGGRHGTGGLTGFNEGTIMRSHASGAVYSDQVGGGLVGYNSGNIYQSYATGAVSGTIYAGNDLGGLVGAGVGTISQSFASGGITGEDDIGGLLGSGNGKIEQSYATGAVSGLYFVGGLVGQSGARSRSSHAISCSLPGAARSQSSV